jgi:hypothetical protein
MKIKLKKIEPLQAGYISGLLYGIISLVIVVPFMFFEMLIGGKTGIGIFMIIGIPLLYGFLGFLSGLIGAALYNFVAKKIGGLEMEIEEVQIFTTDKPE